MKCPKCGSDKLSVVDSRSDGDAIRRRRECAECGGRFSTFERIDYALPMVIKKDGRREPFQRGKLQNGLLKACEKRPVGMEQIDATVGEIERKIAAGCLKEIESTQIGDYLMDALLELDKIAYVRFASVYREFSELEQFFETLKSLNAVERRRRRSKDVFRNS